MDRPLQTKPGDEIKRVITRVILLADPNFNDVFDIQTDASLYQIKACISQKGKAITFYSRELKNCTDQVHYY